MEYKKTYIAVYVKVSEAGIALPVAIEWTDGRRYVIDKVISVRKAPALYVGAVLTKKYEVKIEGKVRVLYEEMHTKRWFVEEKTRTK